LRPGVSGVAFLTLFGKRITGKRIKDLLRGLIRLPVIRLPIVFGLLIRLLEIRLQGTKNLAH
jgi:hypothetical protein